MPMLLSEKQIRRQGFAHYHKCGAEVFEFPTGRGKPRYVIRLLHPTAIARGITVYEEGYFSDALAFAKAKGNELAIEVLMDEVLPYLEEK
jgi:hypothetical protein